MWYLKKSIYDLIFDLLPYKAHNNYFTIETPCCKSNFYSFSHIYLYQINGLKLKENS